MHLAINSIMYNVDIFPQIPKLQKSKKLRIERPICVVNESASKPGSGDVGSVETGESKEPAAVKFEIEENSVNTSDWVVVPKKISLSDLDISKEHQIRISTIVNGKTLAFKMASIVPMTKKETDSDSKNTERNLDDEGKEMGVQERPQVAKTMESELIKELKRKTTCAPSQE